MRSLIQLVSHAKVVVAGEEIGRIEQGILALIGIEKTDSKESANKLLEKMLNYRIFKDEQGKTNLSLIEVQGGLLLVPQFTLVADTEKGLRPGYSKGMPPAEGKQLFEYLLTQAQNRYPKISKGEFGAHMEVTLCNDGPMTFLLEVH